jgi:SAM-dependent methyltransferase
MAKNWAEIFSACVGEGASKVTRQVWRDVFGSEYPEGVEPYSYLSRSELTRFCAEVGVSEVSHLVDVGCGQGGPGLWVAAHTGARLTGVDIAETALRTSEQRAHCLQLASRARFLSGSFDALPLETRSADAIMSVDALLFSPDKRAAIVEMSRVLRREGRLVFTSWDYHSQPAGRPPQVEDHRPLLDVCGFDVRVYDVTEDWLGRQSRVGAGLLAAVEELAAESGGDVAKVRRALEEMVATIGTMLRRVFVVAYKK